jgi:hypothetical protein
MPRLDLSLLQDPSRDPIQFNIEPDGVGAGPLELQLSAPGPIGLAVSESLAYRIWAAHVEEGEDRPSPDGFPNPWLCPCGFTNRPFKKQALVWAVTIWEAQTGDDRYSLAEVLRLMAHPAYAQGLLAVVNRLYAGEFNPAPLPDSGP